MGELLFLHAGARLRKNYDQENVPQLTAPRNRISLHFMRRSEQSKRLERTDEWQRRFIKRQEFQARLRNEQRVGLLDYRSQGRRKG